MPGAIHSITPKGVLQSTPTPKAVGADRAVQSSNAGGKTPTCNYLQLAATATGSRSLSRVRNWIFQRWGETPAPDAIISPRTGAHTRKRIWNEWMFCGERDGRSFMCRTIAGGAMAGYVIEMTHISGDDKSVFYGVAQLFRIGLRAKAGIDSPSTISSVVVLFSMPSAGGARTGFRLRARLRERTRGRW